MVEAFREFMESVDRLKDRATCRLEEPSSACPGQVNVLVQAGTYDGCQSIIFNVMDEAADATFTIPVRTADGQFIAIGHYTKPSDQLPEY